MRSMQPIPGNPWPQDMVLTVTEDDRAVLELLWVRARCDLHPDGDVPPPAEMIPPLPRTTESLRQDKRAWERAWTELWDAALSRIGRPADRREFELLWSSPLGSDERRDLLAAATGPSWRKRFGDGAFDEGYRRWTGSLQRAAHEEQRRLLAQHPERRCLDALVLAWERGLTTVVTIPCVGDYTRMLNPNALCVTRETRIDPGRYSQALHSFGR